MSKRLLRGVCSVECGAWRVVCCGVALWRFVAVGREEEEGEGGVGWSVFVCLCVCVWCVVVLCVWCVWVWVVVPFSPSPPFGWGLFLPFLLLLCVVVCLLLFLPWEEGKPVPPKKGEGESTTLKEEGEKAAPQRATGLSQNMFANFNFVK